ncbi:biotin-dependent carboxyltransferase family protein [Naumannella halotolerans]|uniref:5-oxoprolinase subunit C family protein n=1 Tax=Naumannella halotolerans TaxID=993414 RepID=UPI001FBAB6AB|nr:biotin-dependent carboxyltransferase family protein [Naumannella halotolerans]
MSASGAVDLPAMHLANRLVGNPSPTAVLELPFGSFTARARGRLVLAVTGAESEVVVEREGRSLPIIDQRPIALDDGDLLRIGVQSSGFRAVLALRGGFAVPPVLGSLSTDTLAGLGPAPLAAGDVLGVGEIEPVSVGEPVPWPPPSPAELVLPVVLGPRDDWFDTASIARLSGQAWMITEQANRVGVRLSGAAPLERVVEAELPSEGAVTGSIQVPPSGQPMIFLADHPLTGGYPIIGVVRHDALPLLAQARPGVVIRFQVEQSPEERR